ncbi:HAD hydrolase-like protein [Patescibacteria group bacterium]|nr:HAD hydrolase-like protein [Patescibacteria group bacterium]
MLCDLDDTFTKTTPYFHEKVRLCAEFVGTQTDQDVELVFNQIFAESTAAFATHFVNPDRWETIIPRVVTSPLLQKQCLGILSTLYTATPPLKEGAQEVFEVMRYLPKYDLLTAIITHANVDWTMIKAKKLGLSKIFTHIRTISEDGPKGPNQWAQEIAELGLQPQEVVIVGNSLRSDIQPGHQIGAGRLVWANDSANLSFYRQGELPEGTIVLDQIENLVPTLIRALTK